MALNQKLQQAIQDFARKMREYTLNEDLPDLEAAFARLAEAIAEQALQPTTDNVQIIIDPANAGTSALFRVSHDSPDYALSETLFAVNELKQAILEGELIGGPLSLTLTSRAADGPGAVGIDLNAANAITTDTSKLLRLRSGGLERFAIEHAASAYDGTVAPLLTVRKEDGSLAFQWDLANNVLYSPAGLLISKGTLSGASFEIQSDGSVAMTGGGTSANITLQADGSAQYTADVADTASAVAHLFDTVGTLATPGAVIFAVREAGVDAFVIDRDHNIAVDGTVDGRDIAADGSALDGHLDGTGTKHNADEVAVTGTYANISGTPTDLESTISAIDTALGNESLWDRTTTVLSPQNSGDSLDMGVGGYTSSVADGATAVGFLLNSANALVTAGSKLLSLGNAGVEYLNVYRGTDFGGWTDSVISELRDLNGDLRLQTAVTAETDNEGVNIYALYGYNVGAGADPGYADPDRSSAWISAFAFPGNQGYISIGAEKATSGANDMVGIMAEGGSDMYSGIELFHQLTSVVPYESSRIFMAAHTFSTTYDPAVDNLKFLFELQPSDVDYGFWGITQEGRAVGQSDGGVWGFDSDVADGATAVGFELDTLNAFSAVGAKLLSLKNATVEKFSVDKDGTITTVVGKYVSGVADGAGAIGFELKTANSLVDPTAKLLSLKNVASERMYIDTTGVSWFRNIMYINGGDVGNNSGLIIGNGTLSAQGINCRVAAAGRANFHITQGGAGGTLKNVFSIGVDGTAYISPQQLVPAGTKVFSVYNNTGGSALMQVDANGDLSILGTLIGGASPFNIHTREADGATAVGFVFNTINSLSNATAKLASFRNATAEKLYIDKSGAIIAPANLPLILKGYQPDNLSPGIVLQNLRGGQGGNSALLDVQDSANTVKFRMNNSGDLNIYNGRNIVGMSGGCQLEFLSNEMVVRGGTVSIRGDSGSSLNCELLIQNTNTGKFGGSVSIVASPAYPLLWNGGGQSPTFKSNVGNTSTFSGLVLDTVNSLTAADTWLLKLKNATADKWGVDKDGNVITSGGNGTWVVLPSQGSAGIQAAINAAAAAGGGIVQLLAGTYVIAAALTPPATFNNVVVQGVGDETILDTGLTVLNAIFMFWKSGSGYKVANNVSVSDTSVYTTTVGDAASFLVGERIMIEGTAADGQKERVWNKVKTTGNPATGEIQLETPLSVALTASPYACRVFSLKGAQNLTIRNMKCTGATTAVIDVQGFENVVLENITADKMGFYIGGSIDPSYNYRISNCRFPSDNVVNAPALRVYQISNVLIENCHFENQLVTTMQLTDTQDCTIKKNFVRGVSTTFGNAVGGSQHRRIYVEGNHFENIHSSAVVIDGPESRIVNNLLIDTADRTVDPAIYIGANAVGLLVKGNRIRRAKLGISSGVTSSLAQIVDNIIEDIYAGGTGPYGLSISGSKHIVRGNVVRNVTSWGILAYANDGIFTDNYVDTTGAGGIRVYGARMIVSHNQIRNSTGAGINVDNTSTDCSITFNHTNGQGVTEGSGTGNDFMGNK